MRAGKRKASEPTCIRSAQGKTILRKAKSTGAAQYVERSWNLPAAVEKWR